MTRKLYIMAILVIVLAVFGWYLYTKNIRTNTPNETTAPTSGGAQSLSGFKLPEGFALNIFAKNVSGARVIDSAGVIYRLARTK